MNLTILERDILVEALELLMELEYQDDEHEYLGDIKALIKKLNRL